MQNILLLFDIDGTLIRESRAGHNAYIEALRTAFGVEAELDSLELAGKTDLVNLRDLLVRSGLDPDLSGAEQLLAAYLRHLEQAVRRDPGLVCPGVRQLLPILQAQSWVSLALGTGNLERGARLKLAIHGLDGYFPTGGFGSDAVERAAIIAAGITKAETYFGTRFDRVAVIGDTPRDIACAKDNGVHSIGVATGFYGVGELRQAGATMALADLTRAQDFLAAMAALPSSSSGETWLA